MWNSSVNVLIAQILGKKPTTSIAGRVVPN